MYLLIFESGEVEVATEIDLAVEAHSVLGGYLEVIRFRDGHYERLDPHMRADDEPPVIDWAIV